MTFHCCRSFRRVGMAMMAILLIIVSSGMTGPLPSYAAPPTDRNTTFSHNIKYRSISAARSAVEAEGWVPVEYVIDGNACTVSPNQEWCKGQSSRYTGTTLFEHKPSRTGVAGCYIGEPGCTKQPPSTLRVSRPRPQCETVPAYPAGNWHYGGSFEFTIYANGQASVSGPTNRNWAFFADGGCNRLPPPPPSPIPTTPPPDTPPTDTPPPTTTPETDPTPEPEPQGSCDGHGDPHPFLFQAQALLSLTVNGVPMRNWESTVDVENNPDIGARIAELIDKTPTQNSVSGTAQLTIAPGAIFIRRGDHWRENPVGGTGWVRMTEVNITPQVDWHRRFIMLIKDLGEDQQLGADDTVVAWLELSSLDRIAPDAPAGQDHYWAMGIGEAIFRPAQLLQGRRPINRSSRIHDGAVQLNTAYGATVSGGKIFSAYRYNRTHRTWETAPPYSFIGYTWLINRTDDNQRYRTWPVISSTNYWGNIDILAGADPLTITWPVQPNRAYVVALYASDGQCGTGGPTNYHIVSQRFGGTPPADAGITISGPQMAPRGNDVTYRIEVTNDSPTTITNAQVKVIVHGAGTTSTVNRHPNETTTEQPGTAGTWLTIGDLAPNQTTNLSVLVPTTIDSATTVRVIAEVTAENDSNPSNNRAETVTTLDTFKDAAVTVDAPRWVYAGDTYTVTLTVRNVTPRQANADQTPFPPFPLVFSCGNNLRTSWTVPSLGPNQSHQVQTQCTAPTVSNGILAEPEHVLTAVIDPPNDGNATNNTATDSVFVVPRPPTEPDQVRVLAATDLDARKVYASTPPNVIVWPVGQLLRLAPEIIPVPFAQPSLPYYRLERRVIGWELTDIQVMDNGALVSVNTKLPHDDRWQCPPASLRDTPDAHPDITTGCWWRWHPFDRYSEVQQYQTLQSMLNLFWHTGRPRILPDRRIIALPYNPDIRNNVPNERRFVVKVRYIIEDVLVENGLVDLNDNNSLTDRMVLRTIDQTVSIPISVGGVQSITP